MRRLLACSALRCFFGPGSASASAHGGLRAGRLPSAFPELVTLDADADPCSRLDGAAGSALPPLAFCFFLPKSARRALLSFSVISTSMIQSGAGSGETAAERRAQERENAAVRWWLTQKLVVLRRL